MRILWTFKDRGDFGFGGKVPVVVGWRRLFGWWFWWRCREGDLFGEFTGEFLVFWGAERFTFDGYVADFFRVCVVGGLWLWLGECGGRDFGLPL